MAELTTAPETSSCCAPETQDTCCEPSAKADCCGTAAAGGTCGCSAGRQSAPASDIREVVRAKYAAAARAATATDAQQAASCCGITATDAAGETRWGGALYTSEDAGETPGAALNASLGCGVPTAVADLHEGETVLDLGSGAGADVLISARRVGATGRAIGLDMTDEMLALARANATAAGVDNVEFVKGHIEEIPLAEASVDVVISNCVINLSRDKPRVLREAARVLRPGGRFAVSDVIADPDMDDDTRADMAQWTGCVAGALTEDEFRSALTGDGLIDVEIRPTHRVHEHASSTRARAQARGARVTDTIVAAVERERRRDLQRAAGCCTGLLKHRRALRAAPAFGGLRFHLARSRHHAAIAYCT
jgi:arsenite methyltransferase